jgi:beta-aspartyl-peptidase (threonine type)
MMKLNGVVILGIAIHLLVLGLVSCSDRQAASVSSQANNIQAAPEYAIVIHGGAGTISRDRLTPEQDSAYRASLNEALDIGSKILADGGTALDAVTQTIQYLEENPLFNAGRGAVLTSEGTAELDASIMDGKDRSAGAVGGVKNQRSPIAAARAVMENSPHVFMAGRGAEQFALEQGLDTVANDYFITDRRWKQFQRMQSSQQGFLQIDEPQKFGTVGCAALDKSGHLAAGTSTGGMMNKRYGRIGDSPVIGAGTYADDATCAVSCTGHGEFFIRYAVAHDLSARMAYGGQSLEEAANAIIQERLKEIGANGGLIALDAQGNIAMPFNTEGMYRGYDRAGDRVVAIYGEAE